MSRHAEYVRREKYGNAHNLTAATTLKQKDEGGLYTNLGATGTVPVTLPTNAAPGTVFKFRTLAAQAFQIKPGAGNAIHALIGAAYGKQADAKYIEGGAVGEHVDLMADSNGDWVATNQSGAWAAEA